MHTFNLYVSVCVCAVYILSSGLNLLMLSIPLVSYREILHVHVFVCVHAHV